MKLELVISTTGILDVALCLLSNTSPELKGNKLPIELRTIGSALPDQKHPRLKLLLDDTYDCD